MKMNFYVGESHGIIEMIKTSVFAEYGSPLAVLNFMRIAKSKKVTQNATL